MMDPCFATLCSFTDRHQYSRRTYYQPTKPQTPYYKPKEFSLHRHNHKNLKPQLSFTPTKKMLNAEVFKPPEEPCSPLYGRVYQFNLTIKLSCNWKLLAEHLMKFLYMMLISTMWVMKPSTTPQNTSQLLLGSELVTRIKTLQDTWFWWWYDATELHHIYIRIITNKC